jgi:hypothetical protein
MIQPTNLELHFQQQITYLECDGGDEDDSIYDTIRLQPKLVVLYNRFLDIDINY